ncbi:hypothetical protein MBCUT_03470 [Methanobrevibacter cuticularis]|uniref:Uncharacterized protein n=1 Tax=Methanobrevibacter cuticularis TaxID=47311 RepID=A0A166EXF4_9EURY|nr:hypothetical protein [Methanobrevibacter cuticularis]KZX17115.1 hypothetical protein MBCUT_03470 [Methanobrevibacter cuticularis]
MTRNLGHGKVIIGLYAYHLKNIILDNENFFSARINKSDYEIITSQDDFNINIKDNKTLYNCVINEIISHRPIRFKGSFSKIE